MKEIIIVINQELTDLNNYINAERSNRFKASKIKKQQTEIVSAECRKLLSSGIAINTDNMPLDFEFYWYTKNKRKDKDNIVFAKKFIFDGMVESGLLVNDGWNEIGTFRDIVSVDKENPRVVIKIRSSKEWTNEQYNKTEKR